MNYKDFTTELSACSPFLMQAAMKFTKAPEEASDLMQDTFIKALKAYDKFEAGTNLKGWLYILLRNTFINDYRKKSRTRGIITQNEEITFAQLSKSAYSNGGEIKFVLEDIEKALKKLSAAYSIPFIRYFEGYKYQEIAEELDIPLGTVKTRIHVARMELKKYLTMYDNRKPS